jgi:hypothetical protein
MKMEAISSSEASVHTRSTRRHIPEDGMFYVTYFSVGIKRTISLLRHVLNDIYLNSFNVKENKEGEKRRSVMTGKAKKRN